MLPKNKLVYFVIYIYCSCSGYMLW